MRDRPLRAPVALTALIAGLAAVPAAPAAVAVQGASLSTFDGAGFGSRLEADPRGVAPTATTTVARFASSFNRGDRYGTRIRARVTAPTSGRYQFAISGGDEAILLFSDDPNDATGASARAIAWVPRATPDGKYAYAAQRSARLGLVGGKSYYLEAWQTAGAGSGDGVTVRWKGPGFGMRDLAVTSLTPASGGCATWCPPVQAPAIAGVPQAGVQLTAQPGGYLGSASGLSFAWIRCNAAATSCRYIKRATSATYVPVAKDVGSKLSVRVARPGAGSWLVLFAPLTSPVLAAPGTPPATPAPSTPTVPAPVSSPAAGTAPDGEVAIDPGAVLAQPEDSVAANADTTPAASDAAPDDGPAPDPAPPAFVADTTPPATPVLTADSPTNTAPALSWGAVADAASYKVLRNGLQVATTTDTTYVDAVTADGTYSYAVAATDAAGNTGIPSAAVAVRRDTVPPHTTVVQAPADSATGLVTAAFASDDAGARFECRLDHADWSACDSPLELAGVDDGSHTLDVRAVDAAENADPAYPRTTFVVDTTPPATPAPVAAATPTGDHPTLTWPAVEDGATYTVVRDGTRVGTTTATTFTDASATDGTYAYAVLATDLFGNAGEASAPVGVTVDTVPPAAPVPSAPSPAPAATVSWPAVAGASGYRVERDGVPVATTAMATYADTPADGPHDYAVIALDAAGNASAAAHLAVLVDATPPVAPAVAPRAASADGSATISWPAVADAVSYRVYVDGTAVVTVAPSGLGTEVWSHAEPAGSHDLAVAAVDAAGNESARSAGATVTVTASTPPAAGLLRTSFDVSDSHGAAVAGARVAVLVNGAWTPQRTTDASGTARFDLAPGTYYVQAQVSGGYQQQVVAVAAAHADFGFRTVALTASLVDASGAPVAGAKLAELGYSGAWSAQQATDASGTATFELLPGSYYVQAQVNGGYQQQTIALDADHHAVAFHLVALTATVDDSTGAPVASAKLAELGYSGAWSAQRTTDASGAVSFELLPGSYYVQVQHDGGYRQQTIALDATHRTVAFHATPVTFVVRDATGAVADAALHLDGHAGVDLAAHTDAAGTLTVPLLTGTYSARMTAGARSETSPAFAVPAHTMVVFAAYAVTTPDVPPTPAGLDAAASPTSDAPHLEWVAVPGAVEYVVIRDGAEIARTHDTSFADHATVDDGPHAYAVAAVDAAGTASAPTAALEVTVDTTPPAAPTLTATADTSVPLGAGTGAVILQVAASADTARVVLRRGTTVVLDGAPRDLTDAGLADDARYTYTLTAYDAAGNASPTTSATATTPDRTAPSIAAAPTGEGYPLVVRVDPNPGTTFTLRRDGIDVASGRDPAFTDVDAADTAAPAAPTGLVARDVTSTGFTLDFAAAADAGTTYAYDVRGADDSGNEGAPSPVGHLTATSGTARYRVLVNGTQVAETADASAHVDGLAEGVAWHVRVVAVDAAGNASDASAAYVVGRDEVPTVPTALHAAASPTNDAPALTWQGVEHAARYVVYRDAERVGTTTGTTFADTAIDHDGTYAYTVAAVGNAGQPSAPSEPVEVVVDRTAPVTHLDAAPHGTVRADLQIAFSAGGQATFTCALDDGAAQPCTSPWALSSLADGDHAVAIRATDAAGNVEADAATATFTVDSAPPAAASLTATADADVPAGAGRGAVAVDAEPGAGGVRVVVTQGAREVYAGDGGATRDVVADGTELTYQAVTYDEAGNASEAVAVTVDTPDRTAPSVPGLTVGAGYPLVLHATADAGATVTVARDGASLVADEHGDVHDAGATDAAAPGAPAGIGIAMSTPTSLSVTWSATSDAGTSYAYTVRATDAAGNASAASAEVPALALAGVASYRVLVDGHVALETADTQGTVTGLAPGTSHAVTVVAVDGAGNVSAASPVVAAATGTVSGPHPPRVTLDVRPLVTRPGATVHLHADAAPDAGPLATFSWTFDDGSTATGPDVSHVFATGGSHTVRSTVTDGNGGSAATPITVYVDGVPPVIRLIGRNGHTLSFAGTDADSGIDTIVADVAGRTSSLDPARPVLTLPDGRTVVKLTITDRAGNTAVYTVPVTMDTAAPTVVATVPRLGLAATAAVGLAVTDATSGVAKLTLDGRALATAARSATVATGVPHRLVATDDAGNVRQLAFTVVRVPPIASLRASELDGAHHDSLAYSTRVQTGTRLVLLRGAAARLAALGLVPASTVQTTRFTPALRTALQSFQVAHRLVKAGKPGYGTIEPKTKAALDTAAGTLTAAVRAG